MRQIILGIAVAAGLSAAFSVAPASADPFKWCTVFGGSMGGGGGSCSYTSIEQCRASLSGFGGYCVENQFYTGSEQTVRHKRKRVQS